MHDRHCTSRQLPYDACLLWPYAARNSRAFLPIFLFRRFRSQPFSVFFRAMREISKTPAREWGEKRRGALKCWEKWTLPYPCSFTIELLKELATTNTPLFQPKKKKNVEVRLHHFWFRLNNFDQGGARGGVIAVPNRRDRRSVGKKVRKSHHFSPRL